MAFCGKCGKEVVVGASFCGECGKPLGGGQSSSQPNDGVLVRGGGRPNVAGLSDKWVWALSAIAGISVLSSLILPRNGGIGYLVVSCILVVVLLTLNVIFVVSDGREIKKKIQIDLGVWRWLGCILPCIYVFVRASKTNKKYAYAITYVALCIVGLGVSVSKTNGLEQDMMADLRDLRMEMYADELAKMYEAAEENGVKSGKEKQSKKIDKQTEKQNNTGSAKSNSFTDSRDGENLTPKKLIPTNPNSSTDLRDGKNLASGGGVDYKERRGELKVSSPDILKSGVLTGGRSRASIQRVVMQNMAVIRYAYNRRLRDNPGLAGKITVKFAIDEYGNVILAQVEESTMDDSDLERTVVDRVKSWNFGEIDKPGDVTEVVYPFVFSE